MPRTILFSSYAQSIDLLSDIKPLPERKRGLCTSIGGYCFPSQQRNFDETIQQNIQDDQVTSDITAQLRELLTATPFLFGRQSLMGSQ
jgi:hypothetical protein